MKPLDGRSALIVGATGTLGQAIVEAYALAGARLLLSARDGARLSALTRALAPVSAIPAVAVPCDISKPVEVERLADKARVEFGGIDILINAAAVIGPIGRTTDVDWTEWTRAVTTNFLGAAHLCHLCAPFMPSGGGRGKIVNVSGGGATSPRPRLSAYAAAKAALVRFSETLALELAEHRIDVNCIAPGVLHSRLTEAVVHAGVQRAGEAEYTAATAVVATADSRDRAASLAVFLGSAASDGITGKLISAVWDPWPSLAEHRADLDGTDVYTLRRVTPQDRGLPWGVQ